MAPAIHIPVVLPGVSAVPFCWTHRRDPPDLAIVTQPVAIEGRVRDAGPAPKPLQDVRHPLAVARRARDEDTADAGAQSIRPGDARAGPAAPGAADGRVPGPLIALISTGLPPPWRGP